VTRAGIASLLACVAGCKLQDVVSAPPGAPVLVVESVLSAIGTVQTVLVQQSQTGDTTIGVSGAAVQMTDLDPRGCATPSVQLTELALAVPGARSGTYRTTNFCPLALGDRVTLRVTTSDGRVVTGSTRIPSIRALAVRVGDTTVSAPPASLPMDRTRDSISVSVALSGARALLMEAVRTTTGEDPSISFATDTTSVTIPGNLVDFMGDGRTLFRAGAYYALTVAAMDTAYYDFVRSSTNPLTGRGFINHLTGGIGVFGSEAPLTYELRVTAPQLDPREGRYHLTGTVGGVAVDVTWDVYRDPLLTGSTFGQGDGFCAFVDGQWVGGAVHTSANGSFPGTTWRGRMFEPTGTDAANLTFLLSGTRTAPGTPFPVLVAPARNAAQVDTLTAVQISGP